jgi:endonuclease-3 related protein
MNKIIGLIDLYKLLINYYGNQNWWPAESPIEIVVGAILTQNTNWNNVEKAIRTLKDHNMLNPHKIYNADFEILKDMIKPAGFYNQKAIYLKNITHFILNELDGDIINLQEYSVPIARKKLLSIKGVGFETADSILLYAVKMPIFIVDLYTIRLFSRMKIGLPKKNYNSVQDYIMNNIIKDVTIYNEFHALIVEHSKKYCRKKPLCDICFLNLYCK